EYSIYFRFINLLFIFFFLNRHQYRAQFSTDFSLQTVGAGNFRQKFAHDERIKNGHCEWFFRPLASQQFHLVATREKSRCPTDWMCTPLTIAAGQILQKRGTE